MEGINFNKFINSKLRSLFKLDAYEASNKDLLSTLEFTSVSSLNTNKIVKNPDEYWIKWVDIMSQVPRVTEVDDILAIYDDMLSLISAMDLSCTEFLDFNKLKLKKIAENSLDRRERKNQEKKSLDLLRLLRANDDEANKKVISKLESIGGVIPKLFMDLNSTMELDFVILFLANSGLKQLITSYNETGTSNLFNRLIELSNVIRSFLTERFTEEELVQLSKCGIEMTEDNMLVQLKSLPSQKTSKP